MCFSWQEIHLFPLFISFFIVMFLSFFHLRSGRSDGRWQNTSSRETSEANGGNVHPNLIKESFLGVFLSMTEGRSWWTRINRREGVGWLCVARFGSNSVFLVIDWLVCVTDSPWDTRKWRLVIISSCSLRQLLFSLCLLKTGKLRQELGGKIGQLEAEKLNLGGSIFCWTPCWDGHAMRMVNNRR